MQKVRSVVNKLAKHHCADLQLLKKKAADILGKKIFCPIILGSELVLIPVKVRKPRIEGDNTLAYINLCSVKNTSVSKNPPFKTLIQLERGLSVGSYWSISTLTSKINHAGLASKTLLNQLPWTQKTEQHP
ncbi:hypothetical protein N752_00195 [Desulforamulus aquiferis]|nr:hypothetical protein [Desulforamulus aquiferis]RYD07034.1 hypothetical protein N752_00195 [Desulforamulus aquiferis]